MMEYLSSQRFNYFCASVHFVTSIFMAVAATSKDFIGTTGTVHLTVNGSSSTWWSFSLFSPLALFTAITGVFHLVYARSSSFSVFNAGLRFVEYSITASVLILVLAILCEIKDALTLLCLFGLMATTMHWGYIEEDVPPLVKEQLLVRPFFLGCIPYAFAWAAIAWQFSNASARAPDFVHVIFVGEFLLFSCFAVVQYVFVVRAGSDNRLSADGANRMDGWYNLLSILSKMLLVWVCFGGVASYDGRYSP